MLGRLLTLAAVIASLVAFIAEVTGTHDWWVYALSRASYILVVLALVAALLAPRSESVAVVGAQVLAAAAALAFATVGLVKLYELTPPYLSAAQSPDTWLGEAELLSVAVLAFGLTLARRRSTGAAAWLAAAVVMALGSGTYAITQKISVDAYVWWEVATVGAFLAGAAAAVLERGGGAAPSAPVAGNDPGAA